MNITGRLTELFDFQRFQGNDRLRALIEDTEARYTRDLSDEEMEWVSAAGEEPAPTDIEGSHED